ncbi:group I intron-associated PD-(D/E)XK endonuclease [Caldifermentibacillus hisashii]|uniref:group I intron-associated PD-(D/E)XK endonuclease n=1 Tax=Caldifermentibacillus hisashii TaxID=996558 RepID=UPI0030E84333
MANEAITKGRHAELIAITALLANGWTVMEPTAPDVYDLGITRPGSTEFHRVQVKMARLRHKDGTDWVVVNGTRNNGEYYGTDEIDYFIGVHDGVAYMFKNRGLSEYWCKPSELDERWTRLDASITNLSEAI